MSEQARIDELALRLTEGIINTLSNAAMPASQRNAWCQVMVADTLTSEREDLKLQLAGKQHENDALHSELRDWKRAAERQLELAHQYSAENRINQDIIADLQRRIEEMEESIPPVYTEVVNERREQDTQWGGPEHDDTHQPLDWITYITHQCQKSKAHVTTGNSGRWVFGPAEDYRERLVKIAALAMAAAESHDRKHEAGNE